MPNDWKEYETEILEIFREEYPGANIAANQKREGRYSKTLRQIDILVEGQIAGNRFSIVVDGKFYKDHVDVKDVDAFISMVQDIGAHKGIIITQKGYSSAAIERAYNDPHDIELDILSFEELREYQGFSGIPYSGTAGALLKAPFGWVIDATQYTNFRVPACLYQRGSNTHDALTRGELMYVNFWDRIKDGHDLDALLKLQDANITKSFSDADIVYLPTISRSDAKTALRQAVMPKYDDIREYTGFVEFEKFILFVVLLTPHNVSKRNLKKLESVMLSALPLDVDNKTQKTESNDLPDKPVHVFKEYGGPRS